MIKNTDLYKIFALYQQGTQKDLMNLLLPRLSIAYIELIAAFQPNNLINLFMENTDMVPRLRKGRCSAGLGFKLLAAIEFFKLKYNLKISVRHIPGIQNNSADSLSRGSVPTWLKLKGKRPDVDINCLTTLIKKPLQFWDLGN